MNTKIDSTLYKDISRTFLFQLDGNANNIALTVREGIVMLGGVVTSYSEKLAIEHIVKNVKGVKAIANEIKVNCLLEHQRNDIDIARAPVNAPVENFSISESAIKGLFF